MEKGNQEPKPQLGLEKALGHIREGQMLQFTSTGFRLFEYVETGETQISTIRVGESEYTFRVPVKEPLLQKEVTSLTELFEPNNESYDYDDSYIADKIDTDEFRDWVESLVTPDDVIEAAVKELARREAEGDEGTIPCTNCEGKAQFDIECSCTLGGTTFIDMIEKSEDSLVSLREDGEADPNCGTCEGSGKTQSDCPYCEGCAKAAKYPHIILKNEITGEERVLKLDLATLIVNGDVKVELDGYEKMYPDDDQISEKILQFNLGQYIDRSLVEMGIDRENSARIQGDYFVKIVPDKANITGIHAFWQKQEGKIETGFYTELDNMTATSVLENAQAKLSRAFAWPYGKIKNDEGVVFAEEWVLRPIRPIEDALEDIKTAIAEYGYFLGFTQSFIATGESGPSFFLLDDDGNAIKQLSNDYHVRESLESAWLEFQKIKKYLDKNGPLA
ncbi:hypothetical protein KA043_02750 [Candidatus Saccharibacteria bacterium]|nr:hypothetical protein [Candidatus Saccharibacteria bacterium]